MACIQTENFYFAIRKDTGEPVHISQMLEKDRGLDCNCVCAACKRSLVAKLGRGKRVRHFAHYAERDIVLDCSAQKANESGLHLMAKKSSKRVHISISQKFKSAHGAIHLVTKTIGNSFNH